MSERVSTPLESAYGYCALLLQENDKDRFLADLFIPAEQRSHVNALHAFSFEIARVREVVSEPMPGEIRHQWWRDALEGNARGGVSANPVAAALIDTVERFGLPRAALVALIDARGFDLYDAPMPDLPSLESYAKNTSSVLFRLTTQILAKGSSSDCAEARLDAAAESAGLAYAFTGLIRAFAAHAARRQVYLPASVLRQHGSSPDEALQGRSTPALLASIGEWRRETRRHLAEALSLVSNLPDRFTPAFVPVALVDPYLRQTETRGFDPFRSPVELPQWRRQWALWRGLPKSPPAR
ncbi:MAG: squalene/phytoene synthase family protein [Hyphomicrobiales bacterium]|nr:squalene/phytoene synthase family protein [Hyphomicrobiales bacterium]